MRPAHVALGLLVAVIWGFAFVATKIALESFTPPELTALRFLVAAVPVVLVPRPPVSWSVLVPIGGTLFTGQFLFQFFGIASGMPAGLAAVAVQMQAFFTVLFAAVAFSEVPSRREIVGMAIGLTGIVVIGVTVGRDLTVTGLILTLVAAVSWGVGNVLVKRVGPVDMLDLVAWLSLVPPPVSLALTIGLDGAAAMPRAIAAASWRGLGATLYLGVVATVFAYAIWGNLLQRYPAATVAPFALLVPVVGAVSSSLVLGEGFGPRRLVGMALVVLGLAVIVLQPLSPSRPADAAGDRALG